ncbi:MAG: aminoacyl-tRNA hydrolase [Anaerovibrio sp.]|uniref:aminoacyl-tRNA hydrolase n=1 Tax=Anaerovibrio sp. TaxID=1872532 RepID=UPI0025C62A52|nr:aminoacyl-tRNA hydrolase [Anaerovibrio sp.]MBE6100165.1 aminoacyl-tRNA hydrolase [Anaerovibrio sp.]
MKLIAGLGNPGSEYAGNRHNVGWMFIDALAQALGTDEWRNRDRGMVLESRIGTEKVLLVKPLTYMNNSGECIGPLMHWYKLDPADLIVVHDDMDIPAGTIRIRKKGSAGGHNGLKSIIAHLGDENFGRVRIGIGRPLPGWTVINHVLANFPAEDLPKINEAIKYLIPAVECIVNEDIDHAMNKFNPKKVKKKKPDLEKQVLAQESETKEVAVDHGEV